MIVLLFRPPHPYMGSRQTYSNIQYHGSESVPVTIPRVGEYVYGNGNFMPLKVFRETDPIGHPNGVES